ncbi:hypothetical protein N44_03244 [Microcystis aeruginosa NIES-44]|uniref:Uncharacterized protein n=1 Tax=Microcystis aeruginosa NIES-44 TaxID=449439 RepID=A0A0A1VYK2_MICAE|nr:hypothetical protein N44_03244 [Microcystis aeruginosa NIES-44]
MWLLDSLWGLIQQTLNKFSNQWRVQAATDCSLRPTPFQLLPPF